MCSRVLEPDGPVHCFGSSAKNGKAYEHSSHEWTGGGRRWGGADIQIYTY